MKNFAFLLSGLLCGAGLALSGMANPARVRGFLDITGEWDPTLVFVMAGALSVFGGGMILLRRLRGGAGCFGCRLPAADSGAIRAPLILGAVAFGIGWGLAGFCPGPAIANLGALRAEALVFVPAMALGMALKRRVKPS